MTRRSLQDPNQVYDDPSLQDGKNYFYRFFSRVFSDGLFFYHTDHLGTPVAMTDAAGGLVWKAEHWPFGGIHTLPVSSVLNNLRLPGQYADSETSLHQNWFRDYDAALGRYRESDPLGLRAGPNPFRYVWANPLRWSDRLELKVYECCAPADILLGLVDHCWLKTDTREAGLGNLDVGQPAGAAVPGGQCDSPYLAQTQVVSHAGTSDVRPGTTCTEIPNVDEECVNAKIWTDRRGYGPTIGAFSPTKNCRTWANGVLSDCRLRCSQDVTPQASTDPFRCRGFGCVDNR